MARKSTKRVKLQVGEDLSPTNIARVIEYLETDKPTKKVACEMLGIKYNTARLGNIIDDYIDSKARDKRLRNKKRGTPVLQDEAVSIITEYLLSRSISRVADVHFRSKALIKATLEKYGANLISAKTDYFNPVLLPDSTCRDSFEIDEVVWSARYNCMAKICDPVKGGYWVWILGANAQQSAQATEELGSLSALKDLGVNLTKIANEYSEQR